LRLGLRRLLRACRMRQAQHGKAEGKRQPAERGARTAAVEK
jgi:hypothetical protein